MPSFSPETIAEWRQERVSNSKITKDPLNDWQLETLLQVCENDLKEEERDLERALNDMKICRSNIRSLKKKRENIINRMSDREKE